MPLRRLLAMLTGHPQVVESLSDTKIMRRAAQISVGLYQRVKAGGLTGVQKKNRIDHRNNEHRFLANFKEELSNEYDNMKKSGKL